MIGRDGGMQWPERAVSTKFVTQVLPEEVPRFRVQ